MQSRLPRPGAAARLFLCVFAAAGLVFAAGAPGTAQGGLPALAQPGRDEFDVAGALRGTTLPLGPAGLTARGANRAAAEGWHVRLDSLTGGASRVSRPGRALTGPSRLSPVVTARNFLAGNRPLFRLGPADVTALQPIRSYSTAGLGVTHLTLQQQHQGIPVFRSEVKLDLRLTGEILTVSGTAVPDLAASIRQNAPRLNQVQALRLAAGYARVPEARLPQAVTAPTGAAQGPRRAVRFATGTFYLRPPVVQLVYLPVAAGSTRLAWETTLWQAAESNVYQVLVDAVDGRLLYRGNLTDHAQGLVFDREAPQDGSPFTGITPPVLNRVSKQFDGAEFFAVGDPHRDWWAGMPQTSTFANNALVGSFRVGTTFNDVIPAQNAGGIFDFPLDLAQQPVTYREAAIVNLFFWINRCHDVWYGFGFDEASGNFQENNFALGGQQVDGVVGLAQFHADTNPPERNNANFSTPPDGQSGVMRMFEFDLTNPFRDSDLSSDVIIHEFGHGLTNRIIGNAAGLGGFHGGALGEGLADFQALMVHALETDDRSLPHPSGGWLLNNFAAGIRSRPYFTTAAPFGRTFRNIADTINNQPEIHLAGEIICNAMFTVYGRLCNSLGFQTGRTRTMQLFVDACKLAPDNPTYLDFRDAVLLADTQRFGSADHADIWRAFADHGMGVNASNTGINDLNVVEDFNVPGGGQPPAAPSNCNIELTSLSPDITADVTFDDNSNNETGFKLDASINGGPFQEQNQINIPANTELVELILNGFEPGDTLAVRIRAVNANGSSGPSNTDSITIPGGLDAPTNCTATLLKGNKIRVAWQDFLNTQHTGYRLEVNANGGAFQEVPGLALGRSARNVTLVGFQPGNVFGFRVRAFNSQLNSPFSNTAEVLVPLPKPKPPKRLKATAIASDRIRLTYLDTATNEEGFRIEIKPPGQPFQEIGTVGPDVTIVEVFGLPPATKFAFRVRAFNSGGTSKYSNKASAKTLP